MELTREFKVGDVVARVDFRRKEVWYKITAYRPENAEEGIDIDVEKKTIEKAGWGNIYDKRSCTLTIKSVSDQANQADIFSLVEETKDDKKIQELFLNSLPGDQRVVAVWNVVNAKITLTPAEASARESDHGTSYQVTYQ